MRIVLLSCAGAPFSAEILQNIREVNPEILDQIVSVIISVPKTAHSLGLSTAGNNSAQKQQGSSTRLGERIYKGVVWRYNGARHRLGVLFRSFISKFVNIKFRRIEDFCLYFDKETYITENINTPEAFKYLDSLRPDLVIIATFHNILKPAIFNIPKITSINIHPSYLPNYRGADPINMAIDDKAEWTGVTIHKVDAGVDTGDILFQEKLQIESLVESDLRGKLSKIAARLLIRYLTEINTKIL